MQLLVIDTETTSERVEDADCIEIAGALADTELRTVLWSCATLWCPPRFTTNAAAHVNNISDDAVLRAASLSASRILTSIGVAGAAADAVVAYNAAFDRLVLERAVNQLTTQPARWHTEEAAEAVRSVLERPWVCAHADVRFPRQGSGRKLAYLATDHGIQVSGSHRAADDVRTLTELIFRCPDIDEQVADAQRPKEWYAAIVTYDERGQAKRAGFHWDALARLWVREMTVRQLARTLTENPSLSVRACAREAGYTAQGTQLDRLVLGAPVSLADNA